MWQTITIQSQTNHTFELGPPCRNRWVRLALLKDGTLFTSQRASWEWSSPSVCLTQDMAAMHRDIGGTGAHFMHAHTYACVCIHTCTHAHTLEGTLMWTHVVHTCTHYTCEQCRQQKQQTQASSETIQMHVPVQIKQHLKVYQGEQLTKPRMNMEN